MKQMTNPFRLALLLIAISLSTFFNSCKDDAPRTRTYVSKIPVYMKTSEFRAMEILFEEPVKLRTPGKIYLYGDYLFINEVNKGIHIVDNKNPSLPKFISFINIPGNNDLVVNNNILYADNYIDLLAFDISDPQQINLVKRVEDVFLSYYVNRATGTFVTFKDTLITQVINENMPNIELFFADMAASSTGKSSGQGGSMARFTLMNSHLYTVDQSQMRLFNVSNSSNPIYLSNINIGWGIETIFPYQNKLFIGSTNGMHIYDASNPSSPVKLSTYSHVTSCDPVVVSGKYAYVTLRSGNFCMQGVNILEVLDIENPANPRLVSSFAMQNPHGLGISGSNLFICEGQFGLKAFNATDVLRVGQRLIRHVKNINATDVIPGPKSLIVTGEKGIYQFNYSNPANLTLLSSLKIEVH